MKEWRKVTRADEVVNGQRVRYYDGDMFDAGIGCGEDADQRWWNYGGTIDKLRQEASAYVLSEWEHVEALFCDGVPVLDDRPADDAPVANVAKMTSTTPIDDGGPAFPRSSHGPCGDLDVAHGIPLRDWFAGKALEGDWATQDEHSGYWSNDTTPEAFETRAKMYYNMADAMLKARAAK